MNAQLELKPCPFCGNKSLRADKSPSLSPHIHCSGCGAMVMGYPGESMEGVVGVWNTRDGVAVLDTGPSTISRPLTFGELRLNERFITFPIDGDDAGHGGYRKENYIFMKILEQPTAWKGYTLNVRRMMDGTLTGMPDEMLVLKVH